MNDVQLVVLAHYEDIFRPFYETANQYEPTLRKILVDDSPDGISVPGWMHVLGKKPFTYSGNVNIGWQAAGDSDVILCGDDVRFTGPFLETLQRVAYSDPTIGISCPEMNGQSPWVCGYFKREVIEKVGPMDEDFVGYGGDDNDWAHRMGLAGYRTQPTTDVKVIHQAASTFYRIEHEGGPSVQKTCDANMIRFKKKWEKPWSGNPDRWTE